MFLFVPVVSHLRYIPIPKILITEYNNPNPFIYPKLHPLPKKTACIIYVLFVFFINATGILPRPIENQMLDELDNNNDGFIASDDYSLNNLLQRLKEGNDCEYVNIDNNNIQLWEEPTDENYAGSLNR